jgi:tripartite-type tricarboxylate transporter receptor subunit TctC
MARPPAVGSNHHPADGEYDMQKAWVVGIACIALVLSQGAATADVFYQGKRVTIMINFAPGGPTDIEGRLFARYIGKHLAGHPQIIVQNMDGGGGGVGVNFLGEAAPKDGTMIGYLTGAAWRYVSVRDASRVDFLTYNSIAYQPGTTVYYIRTDVQPAMKTAADILKAKNVVVGGLTADSSKDLLERLTLDQLGVKYRYVTGYTSNSTARLALQRGEINFFAESPAGYRSVVEPSIISKGDAIPLYYDPAWNGTRYGDPVQARGLAMKPYHEFFKEVMGREPSGKMWDIYRHVLAVNGAMQRMVVMPPNVPQAAIAAVREAIQELNKDTEFAAEAEKALGYVPDFEAGPNVQQEVVRALSVPSEDKEWLANYVAGAGK